MKNILAIQSHVVFGHAGNSAAEFPMRRLGANVWPLNTVQFSNHTQYGKWAGCVMPPSHLTEVVQGIADIDQLKRCDDVRDALPASDIIAPNLIELEILCEHPVNSVEEAVSASRELIAQGPEIVLVKHLARAGLSQSRFEMLLVTKDDAWHISRPLVDFGLRQPVGVGDVTSGLLLVKLLQGATVRDALEHVTAAVYEIMIATKEMQEYELQVVAAQDRIAKPEHYFSATRL